MTLELVLGAGTVVGIVLAVWALVKASAAQARAETLNSIVERARELERARLRALAEPLGTEAEWLRQYEDDNGVP